MKVLIAVTISATSVHLCLLIGLNGPSPSSLLGRIEDAG
jgi:hypothetical protein